MSALDGEGGMFGEEDVVGFGEDSMSGSAVLAPTQFNVSGTTSGSRNSVLEDEDRERGKAVVTRFSRADLPVSSFLPFCSRYAIAWSIR